jgi:hypothetical protein
MNTNVLRVAMLAMGFNGLSAQAADVCVHSGVTPTAAATPIVATGDNFNSLQVAWNPDRSEYLAVWNLFADGEHQLYARRLHADGTPVADAVRIAHDGAAIIDPQVAAASGHDSYLVVYQTQNTPFNGARGLRLDGTATLLGDPFAISTAGAEPAVVYSAATQRFLFSGRGVTLSAQYVLPDGTLAGDAITLAAISDGAPAPNGSLAFAGDGRAFANWRNQSARTLAGRRLAADGSLVGSIADYSPEMTAPGRAAYTVWRGADDRFLVLYGNADGNRVAWLDVAADGTGSAVQTVASGTDLSAIGIGIDDATQAAVLAWGLPETASELGEIRAQLLAADGSLADAPVPLAAAVAGPNRAHIATDRARGAGLLVWPGVDAAYARPFAYGCLLHDAIFGDGFDG